MSVPPSIPVCFEGMPIIPSDPPLVAPLNYASHKEATGFEYFNFIFTPILNSHYRIYDGRINSGRKATVRLPFTDLFQHALKYKNKKVYMSLAVFKDLEKCAPAIGKEKRGQRHIDVEYDPLRAIDFDRRKNALPATCQHVGLLANLLHHVAIIKSNGVQIFMRSADDWEVEAPMLAQIGRHLEKILAPLYYDPLMHLNKWGKPGNHRNHCFRAPVGACSDGDVRCWIPSSKKLSCVREVFELLGLSLPEVVAEPEGETENREGALLPIPASVTRSNADRNGSLAANYEEFDQIRITLTDLIKQGMPRKDAEAEVCSMNWQHHTRAGLAKSLPTCFLKGADGKWLSKEAWASVCADLKELMLGIGPSSLKRQHVQKTRTVRAIRAWSFEFLYYFYFTCDDAITAFFKWDNFQEIRELSISAIGLEAVKEDLRECWNKFNKNPDKYVRHPFADLKKVSDATVALVRIKAKALGKFKMADMLGCIKLGETAIKRALKRLCDNGELKSSGKNKGRTYEVVVEKEELVVQD